MLGWPTIRVEQLDVSIDAADTDVDAAGCKVRKRVVEAVDISVHI